MYKVIIALDDSRDRSYYYSYVDKNGNIECAELPPYQDISKARACYWNDGEWVFDEDKYAEITAAQEAEKAAAEQARREAEALPGNDDLMFGLMELANNLNMVIDAVSDLAGEVAAMKGGE